MTRLSSSRRETLSWVVSFPAVKVFVLLSLETGEKTAFTDLPPDVIGDAPYALSRWKDHRVRANVHRLGNGMDPPGKALRTGTWITARRIRRNESG